MAQPTIARRATAWTNSGLDQCRKRRRGFASVSMGIARAVPNGTYAGYIGRRPANLSRRSPRGGDHPAEPASRRRSHRFARAGPVPADDEEEIRLEPARLEQPLHLLAHARAYLVDGAPVDRPHDCRGRKLKR